MNLDELHAKLSKDATYRSAYEAGEARTALAFEVLAILEEKGIGKKELAEMTGLPSRRVHAFLNFREVKREEEQRILIPLWDDLRRRNFDFDPWIDLKAERPLDSAEFNEPTKGKIRFRRFIRKDRKGSAGRILKSSSKRLGRVHSIHKEEQPLPASRKTKTSRAEAPKK